MKLGFKIAFGLITITLHLFYVLVFIIFMKILKFAYIPSINASVALLASVMCSIVVFIFSYHLLYEMYQRLGTELNEI